MEEKFDKLDMNGEEIVSLAGAVAICLSKKYNEKDLFSLKLLFQTIASNISVIEFTGKK